MPLRKKARMAARNAVIEKQYPFFGLENLQDRHVGQRPLQVVRRQSVGTGASVLWRANAVKGIRVATGWQLLGPNQSYSCVPMQSMETLDVTLLAVLAQTSVKLFQFVAGATDVRYGDMTGGGRVGLISENRAALTFSPSVGYPNCVREIPISTRFYPECGTRQRVSQPQ